MKIKHNATLRDMRKDNSKGQIPRIKLQLFAEGGEGDNPPGDQTPPNADIPPAEPKTYTQEELDKLLQQESDKRVSSALEKSKAKFEEEYKAKLEAEKEEAKKLATMNEQEKQKHEIEKTKKDLEDREKAIQFKDLKFAAIDILNEKELPIGIVDNLISQDLDAEKTKENIDTFEKAFREEVEKAVNERLKGSSPKAGGAKPITRSSSADDFVKVIKENQIYNQK